jgi:hypothetical protein
MLQFFKSVQSDVQEAPVKNEVKEEERETEKKEVVEANKKDELTINKMVNATAYNGDVLPKEFEKTPEDEINYLKSMYRKAKTH